MLAPGLLPMEVIQGVRVHVYRTPLYSRDRLERKWRETEAYYIRKTTAIAQRFGIEGNPGASHVDSVFWGWNVSSLNSVRRFILLEFAPVSTSTAFYCRISDSLQSTPWVPDDATTLNKALTANPRGAASCRRIVGSPPLQLQAQCCSLRWAHTQYVTSQTSWASHAYIQSKGKDFRVQRNKFNDTKGSKQANLEGGILHRTRDPVFTVSQWHGEKGGREGSLLTLDWKNRETRCDGWTSCGSWLEQTYCPEAFLTFREI